MIADSKAGVLCSLNLALFNSLIHKFSYPATLIADNVVMVVTLAQLEYRMPTFKMMAGNQARRFKLGQDAVDRRQADILIMV